jgi:hypothetical protein
MRVDVVLVAQVYPRAIIVLSHNSVLPSGEGFTGGAAAQAVPLACPFPRSSCRRSEPVSSEHTYQSTG